MKLPRLVCSLPLLFAVVASGQPPAPALPAPPSMVLGDALDKSLAKAASGLAAGGVVFAEDDHGTVRYSSVGQPAPHEGIPPEKIIFEIGSITKVFTSLLLAQAVVEHRVALDDPISKYLPATVTLDPKAAKITLAELATHSAGLPRMPSNFHPGDKLDPYANYTVEDMYAFLSQYRPQVAPPQAGDYSNLGVALLGHILELVYQQPYADLIVAKVTKPLGLPDTVVDLSPEQQGRFALPYSGATLIKPWRLGSMGGAGALHSTAADLVHFAEVLMNPGSNPLRDAWEIARQPRGDFMGDRIGLNVMIGERFHQVVYSHGGGTGGYRTYLEWSPLPAPHVVVVLADNGSFTPEQPVLSLYTPPPASNADRVEIPLPAGKAADYVGVYAVNASMRFYLMTDDHGQLQTRLSGQPFLPLLNAGNDHFFLRTVAADVQFERSNDGPVDSLTLFQNGHQLKAARTTDPLPAMLWLPADKLKEYVGHYQLAPGQEFNVRARPGVLMVKLGNQQSAPVYPDGPDHFYYDIVAASLTFTRDANGAVDGLILHQNGKNPRAEKLPAMDSVPPAPH